MNTLKRKNHTLEALLSKRVPLHELTPELYVEAKEAHISDNKLVALCHTSVGSLYEFKRNNNLIGVTCPGYENNSKSNRKLKEVNDLNQKEEIIVEGTSALKPATSPAILEYREQNGLLNKRLDQLESEILSKDQEINRLNNQSDKMLQHLSELNKLVRSLEVENEQLRSATAVNTTSLEDDNHSIREELITTKGIIKQLATLI